MINTLLLNIKNTDWYKINEYTYTFTKKINLYNSNVSIQFYDTDGNNLNVGAKIDNVRGIVTFTYDKAENISAVFFVPTTIEEVKESVYKSNYPTSTYLNEDKGWIEQAYKNEQGVPVTVNRTEFHTISPINSAVQLTEIPDKYYGVEFRLKDNTINLERVYNLDDLVTKQNAYYIGKNNMIYCSTNLIGKEVQVSYQGMGKTIINCNMIYYRDAINSVPRILEDLIDAGYRAIDALATIGNAVLIIEQLKEDIKTGNALHQTLASDFITADEKHRIAVNDASLADTKHSRAVNDVNTADSNHTRAEQDSNTANSNHNIAVSDNLKAVQDHNTASSDHSIAVADHTQADKDHIQLTADLEASKQFLLEHPDINTAIGNKVDKVDGKGLSTNDFTNEYKLMLDNMKTEIANLLLPVGITVAYQTNINPNVLYIGQTWVRSFKGQVMVGVDETQTEFNTIDKTGGEKVHVLTSEEAPNKGVDMLCRNNSGSLSGYGVVTNNEGNLMWEEGRAKITGGGQPHNNLQPYKTTYFWTRTA